MCARAATLHVGVRMRGRAAWPSLFRLDFCGRIIPNLVRITPGIKTILFYRHTLTRTHTHTHTHTNMQYRGHRPQPRL